MAQGIDKNRGVTIRKYSAGDMMVYMYKDQPGVFLNAFGKPVSSKIAAAAGFPVDELLRAKERHDRMDAARDAIDREMQFTGDEEVTLFRRGDYKAVQRPLGRAQVYDDEGNLLTPRPIPEEEAKVMLEYLVPGADTEETRFAKLEKGEPVEKPEQAEDTEQVNVLSAPDVEDSPSKGPGRKPKARQQKDS